MATAPSLNCLSLSLATGLRAALAGAERAAADANAKLDRALATQASPTAFSLIVTRAVVASCEAHGGDRRVIRVPCRALRRRRF